MTNKNTKLRQKQRAIKRIYQMIISPFQALFLTLTFNNTYMEKTTPQSREKAIKRFLNKYCLDYIANIDYGAKNNREHYHAIVILKAFKEKIDFKKYKPGALKGDFINKNSYFDRAKGNFKNIAKILYEHATKSTTKGKIIYSRPNKKYIEESIKIYDEDMKINVDDLDNINVEKQKMKIEEKLKFNGINFYYEDIKISRNLENIALSEYIKNHGTKTIFKNPNERIKIALKQFIKSHRKDFILFNN